MTELDDLYADETDAEIEAYVKERREENEIMKKRSLLKPNSGWSKKERDAVAYAKRRVRFFERVAAAEAKEVAKQKWREGQPLRDAESKLKVIQRKKALTAERVKNDEAESKEAQEKIDKATTPIKIGDEIVLDDLVDEILTTYTPAVKKAIYKHRAKNIEKYNTYLREYTQKKMLDPEFARYKKEQTAKSNEKVRLRRLAEREALQKKIILIKTEGSVPNLNLVIQANNGL